MKMIHKKFYSAQEFVHWIENTPVVWKDKILFSQAEHQHKTQTENFEEAIKLAKYGWPEGLKLLAKEVKDHEEILEIPHRPMKKYDVAGVRPDPGRAAAGDMFSMVVKGNTKKAKPVLKIATRMTFGGDIPADDVMHWGAAICSYVNMLEREGYAVELTSRYENRAPSTFKVGPDVCVEVLLKKPEHPLALSSVAFWWAHPSSLRRIKFAAFERMDIEKWYSRSYGIADNVLPVPADTLYLTIEDAGDSMQENLQIIKDKHRAIFEQQKIAVPRFFNAGQGAARRPDGLSPR